MTTEIFHFFLKKRLDEKIAADEEKKKMKKEKKNVNNILNILKTLTIKTLKLKN